MSSVTVARMADRRYLTREEAAAHLRISTRYLGQETAAGRILAVRIGRRVTYLLEDLDEYAERRRGPGPAATQEKPPD